MRRRCIWVAIALLAGGAACAAEIEFPSKPIHFVVPGAPGSAPDIRARFIAPRLAQALGQPVLVENRPGANGVIAARDVARSAPDGHTIMMAGSLLLMSDVLAPDPSFAGMRAFAPVTFVAGAPLILAASATLPVRTVADLLAMARAAPGRVSYSSVGPGSLQQFVGASIEQAAGVKLLEVPYKSQALEVPDLIAGELAASLGYYPVLAPHLKSGRVRALAVASKQRLAALPDVPTLEEAGLAGIEGKGWMGVTVPLDTPEPVIRRLHAELARILKSPEAIEQWTSSGAELGGGTPGEFAAYIREEYARWGKLARDSGIKAK